MSYLAYIKEKKAYVVYELDYVLRIYFMLKILWQKMHFHFNFDACLMHRPKRMCIIFSKYFLFLFILSLQFWCLLNAQTWTRLH